jgi:hypothetical protein
MLSDAYGREAMKKSSVSEWQKQFKDGCKNMEDDERSGHPDFTELVKMLKKCRIWCIQIDI